MPSRVSSNVSALRGRLDLGVVAVVGAGLSLSARYPNMSGLIALLWDAIDADPDARARLAHRLGVADAPAKKLIGDDEAPWREAWQTLAESQVSRRRFQMEFANLDSSRRAQPSASHDALARLIHAGIVECVVSLNWDSALESAYERIYGTVVPHGVLYKPHGDVAFPDKPWTLPHDPGRVTQRVAARIRDLVAEHPRTLLVVGYSESDVVVVEELIAPLDEGWRVTRVGPSVTGHEDIPGTADAVLGELAADIARLESESVWHTVTFMGQRGIEAALSGRRLQPADIAVCPRLPEVGLVVDGLLRDHAVVLNGTSGGGKSVTAYQALAVLCRDGYEVLRLRDDARRRPLSCWLGDLDRFPHRKILLVDDAQDLSGDTVRELAETATADRLVLIVGVDHVAGGVTTLSISDASAVGTLAQYVRENRAELLPKMRELDDRVGDRIGNERFEDRIAAAAREPTAWPFFYTLTGGWHRTSRTALELRDADRADSLAVALALAQVAGVDAGVLIEDLSPYVKVLGRDEAWARAVLQVLHERRLVVEDGGVLRCVHLRAADALIRWMLHPPRWDPPPTERIEIPPIVSAATDTPAARIKGSKQRLSSADATRRPASRPPLPETVVEQDRRDAALLIRTALDLPTTSMRGVAWLLGSDESEVRWVLHKYGVRTPERDRALIGRAMSTPPGSDAGMAAQMLERLLFTGDPELFSAVWAGGEHIREWVRKMTPETGWAIGDLVNSLANNDSERLRALLTDTDPHALAALIPAGGWPHIYSSMRAVDRISQGGGPALMKSVGAALDEKAHSAMLLQPPIVPSVNALLGGLAYLNPEMGLRLFEQVLDYLARQFSVDPPRVYQELFDTIAFLLGYAPGFLRRRKPAAAARRAARKFLRAVDQQRLVATLENPHNDWRWHNFWEFISFHQEADPAGFGAVIDAVNIEALAVSFADETPMPSRIHLFVMTVLAERRAGEVREVLERFVDSYESLDQLLALIHPELAITLLQRSLPLDLGLGHQNYEAAAAVLTRLGEIAEMVAAELVRANAEGFRAGLVANHQPPFTDLGTWIAAADRYAPGFVEEELSGLPAGVVAGWQKALKNAMGKKQISPLIMRAGQQKGTVAATEAAELMKRFPSVAKQP